MQLWSYFTDFKQVFANAIQAVMLPQGWKVKVKLEDQRNKNENKTYESVFFSVSITALLLLNCNALKYFNFVNSISHLSMYSVLYEV